MGATATERLYVAYLSEDEVYDAYDLATEDAAEWRIDYPEFERLGDNGLSDFLSDEGLPEVNDGSLAASLFKLAKRVIRKKISGRAVALDREDAWLTELANIRWEKHILPNAKMKASPRRKWKDAARKAAMFGGQPIISLFADHHGKPGADFIVPYVMDVKLEAGKDSDEDSDIIFWDVYYSKLQLRNMLEEAKEEIEDAKEAKKQRETERAMREAEMIAQGMTAEDITEKLSDEDEADEPYNEWNIEAIEAILLTEPEDQRPSNEGSNDEKKKGHKKTGYHFFVAFQRGVNAPFGLYHPTSADKQSGKGDWIRKWSNPDPSGDLPVHYLYCYQDFKNPYGVGIIKLAGGTQNVLDYMRKVDILATQLGIRPPKKIRGDEGEVDEDSLVWAQDANWKVGNADVVPVEMANGVYNQLPGRISMYQTSLQKMIPMGDTSIPGGDSGDPQVSRTPAGVKMQAQNLSIDDEDFTENVDECWAAVAKSMINIEFANMQGEDEMRLTDEEREILARGGIQFPQDEEGSPTNLLDIAWDECRATFDFEVDPDADKTADEEKALDGKLKAYEMIQSDPTIDQALMMEGKKLNRGELIGDIMSQLTDNDKIIVDISPEDKAQMEADQAAALAAQTGVAPEAGMMPEDSAAVPQPDDAAVQEEIDMVMQTYGVDEPTALAMLEAENQGFEPEEILDAMRRNTQPQEDLVNA